ncbi:MAG: RNA methyltransferase, partial [Clostridiaceae bacterium]|nr:RNA methyltransferase [Clostridiaceae bacterium]
TLLNGAEIENYLFVDNAVGDQLFNNFQQLIKKQLPTQLDDFYENSFRIGEELFQSIANARQAQGVIFIAKKPNLWSLTDWLENNKNKKTIKLALLDKIADPGNLGTIIRTANAFNYNGLILKQGSVDPYIPKVLRSTMGSLFALDLIEIKNYQELNEFKNNCNLKLLISDMNGIALPQYETSQIENGHILAIGNEAHGIDESLKDMADDIISIPMSGNTESLNAAIAFAIMAYQLEQ